MILSAGPFITCMITIIILFVFFYLSLQFQSTFLINGNRLFYIIIAIILLRMAIPINFPFTYSIYSTEFLPKIIGFLYLPIFNSDILVQDLLYLIWMIGAGIQLLRYLIRKIKFNRIVRVFSVPDTSDYSYLYDIAHDYSKEPVTISILPYSISPGIMGLFKPVLILPEVIDFSDQELRFIFAHEFHHYQKHDLWLLLLTDIVCCIHWWNPLVYLMRRWFSLSMEVVNDQIIMKNEKQDIRLNYAAFILQLSPKIQNKKLTNGNTLDYINISKSNLEIRIQYLCKNITSSKIRYLIHVLLTFLLIILLVFSTIFVFESSSRHTITSPDDSFLVSEENSYFIYNGNEYDLYVDGEKIISFETIPEDFESLPVK